MKLACGRAGLGRAHARRPGALAAGLAIVLLSAAARAAAEPAADVPSERLLAFHRSHDLARLGLLVAGLLAFLVDLWARRRGRRVLERSALAALLLLGGASFASYYFFFTTVSYAGFHTKDVYHYYIGSRYFQELGHYGLYDCTLKAWDEGGGSLQHIERVRDLRTLRVGSRAAALARGADCPQRFSPARWAAFQEDLSWFRARVRPGHWPPIMLDHGYHPSPVWGAVVAPIARQLPATSPFMPWVLRADRGLVALAIAALGWGFGLRTAALAAIVWGTGFLWSYLWIGDAFFRQLWFAPAMAGLALLRRGRPALAGAVLAASASMRLFPGVFLLGALAQFGRLARSEPALARARRFVLGAGAAALLLGLAGAAVSGQGLSVYAEFLEKVSAVDAARAFNKVGTGVLLDFLDQGLDPSDPRALPRRHPYVLAALHGVLLLVAGALFLRALGRLEDWEAACLGFAWIPLLLSPMGYYYAFSIAGLPLAIRRPWIGALVLLAALGWSAGGLWSSRPYTVASAIAVLLSLAVLGAAALEPVADDEPARDAAA